MTWQESGVPNTSFSSSMFIRMKWMKPTDQEQAVNSHRRTLMMGSFTRKKYIPISTTMRKAITPMNIK